MAKKRKKGGGCLVKIIGLVLLLAVGFVGYLLWSGKGLSAAESESKRLVNSASSFVTQWKAVNLDKQPEKELAYSFAILSDSHEDTGVFPKIVDEVAARGDVSFVAFLGDASNAGELAKLQQAKAYLDNISVPVHVLPGDHDHNWVPARDLRNFKQVFGVTTTSYSFSKGNQSFIFIDNSDSANGLSESTWQWLEGELERTKDSSVYVFVSTPLYNPYLSFKTMGSQNEVVYEQAQRLRALLSEYPVQVLFAGDTHSFSQYVDKEYDLKVVTVGAAGTNKNLLPLYVLVEIFTDGSYTATSVPYDE